jgi:hypothetical protein
MDNRYSEQETLAKSMILFFPTWGLFGPFFLVIVASKFVSPVKVEVR